MSYAEYTADELEGKAITISASEGLTHQAFIMVAETGVGIANVQKFTVSGDFTNPMVQLSAHLELAHVRAVSGEGVQEVNVEHVDVPVASVDLKAIVENAGIMTINEARTMSGAPEPAPAATTTVTDEGEQPTTKQAAVSKPAPTDSTPTPDEVQAAELQRQQAADQLAQAKEQLKQAKTQPVQPDEVAQAKAALEQAKAQLAQAEADLGAVTQPETPTSAV